MEKFNTMQLIKRRFFAMRNGIVADTLRRNGSVHKFIFGLNLPQIADISESFQSDVQLARELWANVSTRESMLLAPMLFPEGTMLYEEAKTWVGSSVSAETTDVLCHRLLRKLPFSFELAQELLHSPRELDRYAALRLLWHHISSYPEKIKELAELELRNMSQLTAQPARQIIEEIEWMQS